MKWRQYKGKLAFGAVLLLCVVALSVSVTKPRSQGMTHDEVNVLIQRYTALWNADPKKDPLWVIGANPGDSLQIPGVTFAGSKKNEAKAGMELPIRAQLVVINRAMVPESILTTFFHEYGHALHRYTKSGEWNAVDSEAEAIRYCLTTLDSEGLDQLGYREAEAVKRMAADEPYKSAVAKLIRDPSWRKYSRPPQ